MMERIILDVDFTTHDSGWDWWYDCAQNEIDITDEPAVHELVWNAILVWVLCGCRFWSPRSGNAEVIG